MKNFDNHYVKLKRILLNESGADKEALRVEYNIAMSNAYKDFDPFDFNDTDRDVISALMHRIDRMHGLKRSNCVRDEKSQLTFFPKGQVSVTFNSHWNQRSEKELYRSITAYLTEMFNKGGNFGPQDEPFFSGDICHRVSEEQMKVFAETLTEATHQIANHIIDNASENWAWKHDIYAYIFYTYEKFFDYSYHMILDGEAILDFNPAALYETPAMTLPCNVERKMYAKEDKLHDIVQATLDFIEESDICNSNNIR